jgi:hypothetical protein
MNVCTNKYKWTEIRNRLSKAQWDTSATLFLNFTTGVRSVFGIPNIPSVTNDINKRLIDNFRDVKESKVHHGVVIFDFTFRELIMEELRPYFY